MWGEWDEALSSSMGHELKDEIPGATLIEIPERGHSLPMEEPGLCAGLIPRCARGLPLSSELLGKRLKVHPATPAI